MKKLFIIAFLGLFVFIGCADKKKRSHFMPSFFAMLSEDYDPNTKIVSVTTSVSSGTYSIGSTITIQVNFNNSGKF